MAKAHVQTPVVAAAVHQASVGPVHQTPASAHIQPSLPAHVQPLVPAHVQTSGAAHVQPAATKVSSKSSKAGFPNLRVGSPRGPGGHFTFFWVGMCRTDFEK